MRQVADLRHGFEPRPPPAPGFDPTGDAGAVIAPGVPVAAPSPVPGRFIAGSVGDGQRFIVRLPSAWNGRLVVAGTPATRSEYANDRIWSDYAVARGYAFASSNKGIPYNAIVEPAASCVNPRAAFAIPYPIAGQPMDGMVARLGALDPRRVTPADWNADIVALVIEATGLCAELAGRAPQRTYAVGLSNGGAQVRWLLERRPDLVDGGVEWAAPFWRERETLLDYLPAFLQHMPAYAGSGFADRDAYEAIVAAGFPPDRLQPEAAHPSLWLEFFSNAPPFYADVTTFLFARLLDPNAAAVETPGERAAYRASDAARAAVAGFSHSGAIGKPLVGIAGDADALITPRNNAQAYLDAVVRAGRGALYRLYMIRDGGHVDRFVPFGYGLRSQTEFAWAAFDQLIAIVERGSQPGGAGRSHTIDDPREIVAA